MTAGTGPCDQTDCNRPAVWQSIEHTPMRLCEWHGRNIDPTRWERIDDDFVGKP